MIRNIIVQTTNKSKRNTSNQVSMKKLASVNKNTNKSSYCTNLKSNREQFRSGKQRTGKEYINNSSSSSVICTSIDSKKNNTYMSNHIKRMLNGCINSSNPSIYANRKKGKIPLAKNIKEFNFGSKGKTTKSSTSRQVNFNNTQKVNIEEHLDGMKAMDQMNKSRLYSDSIHSNLKNNSSSNKFRLILNKNKESTSKYSYLQNNGYNRGIERHLAEYKGYSNKTPSHNSRTIYKNSVKTGKIKFYEEESHPYYKNQKRTGEKYPTRKPKSYPLRKPENYQVRKKDTTLWKNMTQKEILGQKSIKLHGVSPSSTKNCTSHYMKFNLQNENY